MINTTNKYYETVIVFLLIAISLAGCTASDPVLIEKNLEKGCSIRLRSFHDWEMSVPIYFDINCIENNKTSFKVKSGAFAYLRPENIQDQVSELSITKKNNIIIVQHKDNNDVILAFASLENGFVYPSADQVGDQYHHQKEKIALWLKKALNNPSLTLQR